MTFAENFRKARKLAKITQQSIADNFGISRVAVAQWESGETMPEADRIPRLAKLVNSTPDELFIGGTSKEPQSKPPQTAKAKKAAKPDELLERIFDLMSDVESLAPEDRARFDKAMAAHHKLREVMAGKGRMQ